MKTLTVLKLDIDSQKINALLCSEVIFLILVKILCYIIIFILWYGQIVNLAAEAIKV